MSYINHNLYQNFGEIFFSKYLSLIGVLLTYILKIRSALKSLNFILNPNLMICFKIDNLIF